MSGYFFFIRLRTSGAEAAASAVSNAATNRTRRVVSIFFHSLVRRSIVFFEAVPAFPSAPRARSTPRPERVASVTPAPAVLFAQALSRVSSFSLPRAEEVLRRETVLRRAEDFLGAVLFRFVAGAPAEAPVIWESVTSSPPKRSGRVTRIQGGAAETDSFTEMWSRAPRREDYFSPAAGKTGVISTGMSLSFEIVARISGVAFP